MRNRAVHALIIGSLVVISASLVCCQSPPSVSHPQVLSRTPNRLPSPSRQTAETPLPTFVPPLANVDFPEQVISYPPNWPNQIHYPKEFFVVEALAGTLPGGRQAYTTKLRFKGTPESAAESLSAFFTSSGWQVERTNLDDVGFVLNVKNNQNTITGVIDLGIDTQRPNETKVLAVIIL